MAASMFAQACDALVRERDRAFLERIAADYNLNFEELSAKYLETALKVPRKYTKKAKEVTVVTEPKPKTPKEPKAKATGETKTPALPDSLRRKEVLAIQSDPRRFVADRLNLSIDFFLIFI
jgi:hypothetical protein